MKLKRILAVVFTVITVLTPIVILFLFTRSAQEMTDADKFVSYLNSAFINLCIVLIVIMEIELFHGILYFGFEKEKKLYKTIINLIMEGLAVIIFFLAGAEILFDSSWNYSELFFCLAFGIYCVLCLIRLICFFMKRERSPYSY